MTPDAKAAIALFLLLAFTALVSYGVGHLRGERYERRRHTDARRNIQLALIATTRHPDRRIATWDQR